jgi:hypothetical protein
VWEKPCIVCMKVCSNLSSDPTRPPAPGTSMSSSCARSVVFSYHLLKH